MEYHLSIEGEFLKLKIKTETFLGMGGMRGHGLDLGLEKRQGQITQDPKGTVKNLKVYTKISRKQLLILGEGEDRGTEK